MEFLKNPLIIGGIFPMILFGAYNILFTLLSKRFSFAEIFLGYGFAFLFAGIIAFLFLEKIPIRINGIHFLSLVGMGFFLVVINFCMIFAFSFLNGKAAEIVPIITANSFFTALLAIILLGEEVSLWRTLFSSLLIIGGVSLLMWKS
jgi:drug/metabolite transporter (DMT)-like permease